MRLTLLQKGFLGFGTIIGLGMLLLWGLMNQFFWNYDVSIHKQFLKHHADYLERTHFSDQRDIATYARAHTIGVTLIAPDGTVWLDTEANASNMENQLSRPEIRKARATGTGMKIRTNETLPKKVMYMAIKSPDGSYIRTARDLDSIHHERLSLRIIIASLTLLLLITVLVLLYGSLRRLLTPLKEVSINLEKLAGGEGLDLSPASEQDEVGALTRSMNRLIEKISLQQDQLKSLENIRRDFVANVSHELRTPLTAMTGFIQTLEDGALDDPKYNRRFLTIISRNVERLTHLVNDILVLARIESDTAPIQRINVKEELITVLDEMGINENPRISLTVPDNDVFIDINPSELQSALRNYIDNAIKYAPDGPLIIELSTWANEVTFSVKDQGPGIAEEHQERLFERFYRPDKDRSRECGGTGLGLSIVKHIVQNRGGRVSVTSEVGKGSTFSWSIPKHHRDVT